MILPVNIDHGRYRGYGVNIGTVKNPLIHSGYDFGCPVKTSVRAIDVGKICWMGQANGFGGFRPSKPGGVIIIKHGNIMAIYGHVKFDDHLSTGNEVDKGRLLGTVDNYYYGKKDGTILELPHLHFCIYIGKNIFSTKWGYVESLEDFYSPLDYIKDVNNGIIF